MDLYFTIVSFIFGTVLGSFYNVVGYRLPKGQSLISPSSHCTTCNHKLGALELIPVISYIIQGGKCKNCKAKVSLFYPIFELSSGLLFAISYIVFGQSIELAIALTLISTLLIIIISDYQTMIIPDEVLIVGGVLLLIELFIKGGFPLVGTSLLNGVIAFSIMFAIKLLGDFIFKKESMGGGDIKLMALFGIVFGWELSIIILFFSSFIGLPVAIFLMLTNKLVKLDDEVPENSIPFGPFLAIAAIIILLANIDFKFIIDMIA